MLRAQPDRDPADAALFEPRNLGQRIDYAARAAIGFADPQDRRHAALNPDASTLARLRNAVTAWYGARALGREAFRERFLDPSASDETVDRLRSAARLAVEARSHAGLGRAAAELAGAVRSVGLGNWRRFVAAAEERAMEAVSRGEVPGVVRASGEGDDTVLSAAFRLDRQEPGPQAPPSTASRDPRTTFPNPASPDSGESAEEAAWHAPRKHSQRAFLS